MLQYKPIQLSIAVDADFGVPRFGWGAHTPLQKVSGISTISNGDAYIDTSILKGKNFWLPVEMLLNKLFLLKIPSFADISDSNFIEFVSKFGDFKNDYDYPNRVLFNTDNSYDLESINLDNSDSIGRINFKYKNSPVTSIYLMDLGKSIRISIEPYTKTYYTISEQEWVTFVRYLDNDISESRDIKLCELLDTKRNPDVNIIRQLRFVVKYGRSSYASFLSDIFKFYSINGFLTIKQLSSVRRLI